MAKAAIQRPPQVDPTVYPTEDHRAPGWGEGSLQRFISELIRSLIERYLKRQSTPMFVGANQFIYWKQFNPSLSVAPDVFVLPGVTPGIKIDRWKTWETGIVPSFALEVTSQDYLKDYRDGPELYDALGVRELIIFDPEYEADPKERLRFQVFRRVGKRGLCRVEAINEDRVLSKVLRCWLRVVGNDVNTVRLRIATGPTGDMLLPTAEEAERAALEAERAALAEAESERAARAEAEAEIARLRAEVERLRGKMK